MKILIAGDFVINQYYAHTNVSDDIKDLFSDSNLNIVNLEAPVTTNEEKIVKTGPHIKSDILCTKEVLNALNINLCTLANNHILDYHVKGMNDTLDFCNSNNINTVGAGKNKSEAAKIFVVEHDNVKLSIINVSENEWASATDLTGGANGMDIIDDINSIQLAKQNSDLVIVIVHGGHEYYNLPSPRMQKQYRCYIDNGADLVVGHHPHCISGSEVYKGKSIFYSLGNFLFTIPSNYEDWYTGMLLEINIDYKKKIVIMPHFVRQDKNNFHLFLLKDEDELEILERYREYSLVIKNQLNDFWSKYIDEKSGMYKQFLSCNSFISNKYFKAILEKLGITVSSKRGRATLLNMLRCEAHADMSKEILKINLKK